ncbi:MAG: T9SS C-terminal target domain-containing protein [Calditrichaeota bacterium]|nr:MAG: T9SS C-terminal target domain-containing protein [Calditrichota bacterium]
MDLILSKNQVFSKYVFAILITFCSFGIIFSQIVKVDSETIANTTTTSSQKSPKIAMDSNNNFVIVWESEGTDGSGYGIYAQLFSANGTKSGSEFKVNSTTSNDQRFPSIGMDDSGNFCVVWMSETQDGSGWGIYAQRYNSAGVVQGSEFLVNSTTSGQQKNPSIAMDSDGDFVVVWQEISTDGSSFGIKGQRFNSSGVAQGSEFQVNSSSASFHGYASVAIENDGAFVVVWQSLGLDGSGQGIYGQLYNSSGVAQGSEFLVNSTTSDNQTSPSVAMDSTGNFIVSWTSYSQDGEKGGIYAQRFLSNCSANGSEFLVNTTTSDDQKNSVVSANLSGEFTIIWESYEQDGSYSGVYLQSYNSDGSTSGEETLVNTRQTDFQQSVSIAQEQNSQAIVATWQDGFENSTSTNDSDDYGIYFQKFSSSTVSEIGDYLLNFDGTNDYVDVPSFQGITGTNPRSGEAWIKTTDTTAPIFAWGVKTAGAKWNFRVQYKVSIGGIIRLEVEGGGIAGSTNVADGKWHHVAFTFEDDGSPDVTDVKLYVDGNLETITVSADEPINTSGSGNLQIAKDPTGRYFGGLIDEVRIWSDVRTQSELQENMNKILNGNEANLEAYYNFDHNSGLTLSDLTNNSYDGTLTNMATDDWVSSNTPVGESGTSVNSVTQTNIGSNGKQMKVTITSTSNSSNYLNIYKKGNGSDKVDSGENFPAGVLQRSDILWGVNEFGSVTADLIFDYSSIVGAENPSSLYVLKRSTPSDDWTDVTSSFVNDTNSKTFSGTGFTTFSEFSIGGGADNPLPVELTSFTAKSLEKSILLSWTTQSEFENLGFVLERKIENESEDWVTIATYESHEGLQSQGNSSSVKKYAFEDEKIIAGKSYSYRIGDVSYSNEINYYSEIITASSQQNVEEELSAIPKEYFLDSAFPNPFNPSTTISYGIPKDSRVSIVIYNILGKKVRTLVNENQIAGFYKIKWNGLDERNSPVSTGVYFAKIQAGNFSKTSKMTFLK